MTALTFELRYDDDVLRAEQRFIRLVGDPVLRSIGKPPDDFPLTELKHALADKLNTDPRLKFELKSSSSLYTIGQRLIEKAPLPINYILREFPRNPDYPFNLLHCEFEAFEFMTIELVRRCIASGAILCLAIDMGHFSVLEPEFFHCPDPSHELSLPPVSGRWSPWDIIKHYHENSGVDFFYFVFFDDVKHLIGPASTALSEVTLSDKRVGEHGPSPKPMRGFEHLDAPYVEKAMKMLEGCQVSSPREAARIAAEELEKVGDTYPGKYPGASQQAIHDRIYRQLLKALKLKNCRPIP